MHKWWVTVGTARGFLGAQVCVHSAEEAQSPCPKQTGGDTRSGSQDGKPGGSGRRGADVPGGLEQAKGGILEDWPKLGGRLLFRRILRCPWAWLPQAPFPRTWEVSFLHPCLFSLSPNFLLSSTRNPNSFWTPCTLTKLTPKILVVSGNFFSLLFCLTSLWHLTPLVTSYFLKLCPWFLGDFLLDSSQFNLKPSLSYTLILQTCPLGPSLYTLQYNTISLTYLIGMHSFKYHLQTVDS